MPFPVRPHHRPLTGALAALFLAGVGIVACAQNPGFIPVAMFGEKEIGDR